MLRDYQKKSIDHLYKWIADNSGNPCLVLPTGSGKSHVIAALCKDALQSWPDTRILMLTHVKELIEQNAAKMREHWANAPMGIYSAGIGRRELGEPITFAGIQSVRDKSSQIGHIDLILIDECHLVSHRDEGGYRKLINELSNINPSLRIIGLTATPYRLGHGLITDKPALFDELIEPVTIEQLVFDGYLSILRSKRTATTLDTSGVRKRGGEFIESQLQAAVDTDQNNIAVAQEIIALAGDRRAWLLFCAGVQHAQHMRDVLNSMGIAAACVTGDTPKRERERILSEFQSGKYRALTNANVLTTGYDYPDIDLIAMLRPTMSPGLYMQMAGRGMRIKSHADHCLVLDFAGVVQMHGPIINVQPPKKGGDGDGIAPTKVCENCNEEVHLSVRICPACGHPFPDPESKKLKLHDDDIMGLDGAEMEISTWKWHEHVSAASGKHMLKCTYYGIGMNEQPVTEYLPVLHDGYAGKRARQLLIKIAVAANSLAVADHLNRETLLPIANAMNELQPPALIHYKRDGKFFRVLERRWG